MRECMRSDGTAKRVYLTKQDVKRALRERPGTEETGWNRSYRCTVCGYYHIGRMG